MINKESAPLVTNFESENQSTSSSIDRPMVKAIAWTGIATWSAQLITWLSSIIVARLLSPVDYGIIGMALLYLGLVTLLSESGIGLTVVQIRELQKEQLEQLNTVAVTVGLGFFVISLFMAFPLGWFFNSPQLPMVVITMSLTFVISSLKTVPDGVLQKELEFKFLAYIDTLRALVQGAANLAFAFAGFRYWTFVFSGIAGTLVATTLTIWRCPVSFSKPAKKDLSKALLFSRHVLVGRLSWYIYGNSDYLVAGRVLGPEVLGIYSLAYYLATIFEKVTNLLSRVVPAFFSAVQDNHDEMRRQFLNLTEAIALTTFPVCIGTSLVAPQMVQALLGPKWKAVIMPLTLLTLYACFRAIAPLMQTVLTAAGQARFSMHVLMAAAVLFPTAFYFASRWGGTGIALTWVILYPFLVLIWLLRIAKTIKLPLRSYVRTVLPATTGCIFMAVAVLWLRQILPESLSVWVRLGILIATGATCYALTLWTLFRDRVLSFARVVKLARG